MRQTAEDPNLHAIYVCDRTVFIFTYGLLFYVFSCVYLLQTTDICMAWVNHKIFLKAIK